MFESTIGIIISIAFLILYVMLIVRFFEMSSDLKEMKSMLSKYYHRDFAVLIKEDRLKAEKSKNSLTEDFNCVHCDKKVGLDMKERELKIFICPYCGKENDLN